MILRVDGRIRIPKNSGSIPNQGSPKVTDPLDPDREAEFVNLLRRPGIDLKPGGLVRQPYLTYRAGIFKKYMGARHRGGIGFSNRAARLHRLAEFFLGINSGALYTFKSTGSGPPVYICWRNRFLGSLKVYKFGFSLTT
jgi:hypothetical protein